ncbi:MAG TPA: hypothetical protein HA356_08105 [Candidatus Poseidoniaceae archaeon]|nr:MAG TPA: hypothetical protein D7H95_08085 [Candidatus Poseidoniales archaeon]HII12020.1 hypothetical protein [Candidatus Poseidoniaceae archaeon]
MSLRPAPSHVGTAVRGVATILIVIHILMSAWLVVQFDGRYTEGRPSPTNIKAIIAVDDEQTLIDIKMENSTSFVLYMLVRDYDEPKQNETTPSEQPTQSSDSSEDEPSKDRLDQARLFTKACLSLLVLSELVMLFGFRLRATLRGVVWSSVLLCFLVLLPGAYLSDLTGGEEGDEESESTSNDSLANETFVAQTEDGAMVHGTSSVDLSLAPLGVHVDMMFNGYDLGLVEKSNQSTVRAEAPEEGSKDASSWIQFESRLTAKAGKNIQSLFILPVLWLVFPAVSLRQKTEPEDHPSDEEA